MSFTPINLLYCCAQIVKKSHVESAKSAKSAKCTTTTATASSNTGRATWTIGTNTCIRVAASQSIDESIERPRPSNSKSTQRNASTVTLDCKPVHVGDIIIFLHYDSIVVHYLIVVDRSLCFSINEMSKNRHVFTHSSGRPGGKRSSCRNTTCTTRPNHTRHQYTNPTARQSPMSKSDNTPLSKCDQIRQENKIIVENGDVICGAYSAASVQKYIANIARLSIPTLPSWSDMKCVAALDNRIQCDNANGAFMAVFERIINDKINAVSSGSEECSNIILCRLHRALYHLCLYWRPNTDVVVSFRKRSPYLTPPVHIKNSKTSMHVPSWSFADAIARIDYDNITDLRDDHNDHDDDHYQEHVLTDAFLTVLGSHLGEGRRYELKCDGIDNAGMLIMKDGRLCNMFRSDSAIYSTLLTHTPIHPSIIWIILSYEPDIQLEQVLPLERYNNVMINSAISTLLSFTGCTTYGSSAFFGPTYPMYGMYGWSQPPIFTTFIPDVYSA